MSKPWQIKDIIDLEFFFHLDTSDETDSERISKAQRDRTIYLNHILPLESKEPARSRKTIIRLWLSQRRKENRNDGRRMLLPGELYHDIYRMLFYGLGVLGLMSGGGLALSFLSYRGTEPLNISLYLGTLIFLQFFFLVILIFFSLLKWVKPSFLHRSITYQVIGRFLVKSMLRWKRRARQSLSGSQRMSLETAISLVKGEKRLYGSLFYWPIFILIQIFGVGFNMGVLISTCLRVVGSDLAFGWQSTIQFSSEAVFRLAQLIASPWAWMVPSEMAYPSLQQIEGSRIILKDGIHHLATPDLVAWWPFLCLGVLFYGLLPRLLLLIIGWSAHRTVLGRLRFRQSLCDQLLYRMQTPFVSTKGRDPKSEHGSTVRIGRQPDHQTDFAHRDLPVMAGEAIVLIPDDIFDACPDDAFNDRFLWGMGFSVTGKYRIDEPDETIATISRHRDRKDADDPGVHVVILQEAWQPPIQEFIRFIQKLRSTLGPDDGLTIALIGKPSPETIFTNVTKEDWNVWRKKIMAQGDPYLRIERLVENGTP